MVSCLRSLQVELTLVTTRSPLSLARTSRHAITRRARPFVLGKTADELAAGEDGSESGLGGSKKLLRMVRPVDPLFSGWNCGASGRSLDGMRTRGREGQVQLSGAEAASV